MITELTKGVYWVGVAFGSYGWTGEAVGIIEKNLEVCKIPVVAEGIRVRWQPTSDDLARCEELGQKVAQLVRAPSQ